MNIPIGQLTCRVCVVLGNCATAYILHAGNDKLCVSDSIFPPVTSTGGLLQGEVWTAPPSASAAVMLPAVHPATLTTGHKRPQSCFHQCSRDIIAVHSEQLIVAHFLFICLHGGVWFWFLFFGLFARSPFHGSSSAESSISRPLKRNMTILPKLQGILIIYIIVKHT